MPFDPKYFDNNDVNVPNGTTPVISTANTIVLTTVVPDPSIIGTSSAQDLYQNHVGDLSTIFGANAKPSVATHALAASANQNPQTLSPQAVDFGSSAHFNDSNKYIEQQLFEKTAVDPTTNQKTGYMVVVDEPNSKGEIHYR